jgi:DNA-binding MarR family transcriptional regulator
VSDVEKYFTRVHNKLNKLEKKTIDFGTGDKLFASELHTIQAIGENYGKTVTELSSFFGITKGAVSQIISKLKRKKCVSKARSKVNVKEIDISLTDKGWNVFNSHKKLHLEMDGELLGFMGTLAEHQIGEFLTILLNIEKNLDKYLLNK